MIVYPGFNEQTVTSYTSRLALFDEVDVDGFHVDLSDGLYVSNLTISLSDIKDFHPTYNEVHLMVIDPAEYIDECAALGVSRVLVHYDSFETRSMSEVLRMQERVHSMNMRFCLVYRAEDVVDLSHDHAMLDRVMIMSVTPGSSGQAFLTEQVEVVEKIAQQFPTLEISVDGHMDIETARIVKNVGASIIVSTSYLSEPVSERYSLLKGI